MDQPTLRLWTLIRLSKLFAPTWLFAESVLGWWSGGNRSRLKSEPLIERRIIGGAPCLGLGIPAPGSSSSV